MSKYVDFDQMWAESMPKEGDRPKIKVLGEDITLPGALPARMLLWGLRMQGDETRDLEAYSKDVLEQLSTLVGAEKVDEWLDKGISFAQLDSILGHVYSLYLGRDDDDESDEGNEKAPEKGQKKA